MKDQNIQKLTSLTFCFACSSQTLQVSVDVPVLKTVLCTKGEYLGPRRFTGQLEHKVGFKQFIKCSRGAGFLAGDELFVHYDVVNVSPVLCSACSEEVQPLTLSSPHVVIDAAA